jgi:hypothetical protein
VRTCRQIVEETVAQAEEIIRGLQEFVRA